MKYNDFKIFKFSTISKIFDYKRYNFSRFYKNINFRRYKYIPIRLADIVISIIKHIFSWIYKSFKFIKHHFLKIYKNIDLKKYNFLRIDKYFDLGRYNFSRIYRYFDFKKYKYAPAYIVSILVFLTIIYLNIPMFFNYDKSKLENIICTDFKIKCSINGKIEYSFFPSPRIKIKDFIIHDFVDKEKSLGKIGNVAIKLSPYNLLNKEKINFTKIELKNAEINFDVKKFNDYKNFSKKKIDQELFNLKKGKINFFEGKKYIATIRDVSFKYDFGKNINEAVLNGKFLNDKIRISLQNKKTDKDSPKVFTLKFFNLNLFAEVNILNSDFNKDTVSGNLLFKKDKNRLTAAFDYKDDRIIFKKGNLRNSFLDGEFSGGITLLPYFDFDLDIDLDNIYFTRLYNFLIELDKKKRKNLFRVNNKINGQLNLFADKVYSKYSFIRSFETRIQFVNGDISIEQLLLNLGKLGAADITGLIKKDKQFANFNFEKNIFIDNQRYFYSKFGIYNKQNIPSNLFISGNFDLINANLSLYEISNDEKYKVKDEDVAYIEREFNDLLLVDGYASFFNYLKLKEFIRLIVNETN